MKKLLIPMIAIVMGLSFASCEKTQEQILQEMIEAKLKENMNNPKSYEFVSMSSTDSIMSKWKEELEALLMEQSVKALNSKNKRLYSQSDMKYLYSHKERIAFLDSVKINNNKMDSILKVYESKMNSYVPKLKGYSVLFKFRGQNEFGATVLNEYKIVLNNELTEIVKAELVK